jgi:hypothetical protein
LRGAFDDFWPYFLVLGLVCAAVARGLVSAGHPTLAPYVAASQIASFVLVGFSAVGALSKAMARLRRARAATVRKRATEAAHGQLTAAAGNKLASDLAELDSTTMRLFFAVGQKCTANLDPNAHSVRVLLAKRLIEPTRGDQIAELHAALEQRTVYRLSSVGLTMFLALQAEYEQQGPKAHP